MTTLQQAPSAPRHRTVANTLGMLDGAVGLLMATLSAVAINRLAAGRAPSGLAILAVVVAIRWLVAEALAAWFQHAGRQLRQHWRSIILDFFLAPNSTPDTPVDIASAIDTLVDEPRLAIVRAGAQASIVALAIIFASGGWQTLGIVVLLLGVAVPLYQRAGSRAAALELQYRERRTRLAERQLELLVHGLELRGLGAVPFGAQEIAALSDAEHHVALRAIRTALGSSLVTEFLSGVSIGLVAMDVGFGLLNGRISLLRSLICVLVTSELFTHVRRYGVEFHRREAIEAARARLSVPARARRPRAAVLSTDRLVTFAHPEPVSLSLRRGDRVAVRGPSGVGKTTLAHTLLGWRAPRVGQVERTSEAVAYVSVDTTLIEGTLGDNLRLGLEVSDDEVMAILRSLLLTSEKFNQLSVRVSANGEGFSSGERIRILIGRALMHRARLMVLDDVAGLLDAQARDAIRSVLSRHNEMAIIEICVDDTSFISASITVELT